jgi:quinol monooxygenase YgiN
MSRLSGMESKMTRVVVFITAKPGRREEFLALFKANVPAVLKEKGCREYTPVIDAEGGGPHQTKFGPDTFVVMETWESLAALEAHRTAPHMLTFSKAAKDLIADRKIYVLSPA